MHGSATTSSRQFVDGHVLRSRNTLSKSYVTNTLMNTLNAVPYGKAKCKQGSNVRIHRLC